MKKLTSMVVLTIVALLAMTGCGATLDNVLVRLSPPAVAANVMEVSEPQTMLAESLSVLDDLESALASIYDEVNPSVVSIQVVQHQEALQMGEGWEQFSPNFELPEQSQQGSGSGFVWDKEGHIVTNNHVVAEADRITVRFSDGTTVPAELIGTDADSDLAVIKVDMPASRLQPVALDGETTRVGQVAIAIGSPFGLENTMTVGFVSAIGRSLPVEETNLDGANYTIPDIIQTDAPINPGNSGGVLVNDEGQLIGVTSAIISPVQASVGIGFAIPARIVEKVVPALIEDGQYAHAWLGISGMTLSPDMAGAMDLDTDQRGALVIEVVPEGPADEAKLQGSDREATVNETSYRVGGDVIVAIDDEPVLTFDDIVAYLARTEVGQSIRLKILRDGRESTVNVTLGSRPGQEMTATVAEEAPIAPVWLGIMGMELTPEVAETMDIDPEQEGVLIEDIAQGSPADEAGLHGGFKPATVDGQRLLTGGDVIVAWEDVPVTSMVQLQSLLSDTRPGDKVTLTVLRDDESLEISITLAARD